MNTTEAATQPSPPPSENQNTHHGRWLEMLGVAGVARDYDDVGCDVK